MNAAGAEVSPAPIPVTIVTGFLGAGKTTLVNHMLTAEHGHRIGVVVNDFGAINVDAELVTEVADGMVSLANGCVCCSIRTDLIESVLRLASLDERPEHIVIESSGVAEPTGVYQAFLEPEIRNDVLVDGVLTVVDAENVLETPGQEAELARAQIDGSDLILLNKIDTVDADTKAKAEEWIRHVKPAVEILEASYCRAPIEVLLGVDHVHDASASPPGHAHDVAFETWSYTSRERLKLTRLQQVLNHLPTTVFRVKGFLYSTDKPNVRLLLQMVGRRAVISANRPWNDDEPMTRLVLIARAGTCDFDAIGDALNACRDERPRP